MQGRTALLLLGGLTCSVVTTCINLPACTSALCGQETREEDHVASFKRALDGYCPVTLREKRKWQLGDRKWSETYQDREFLFAGLCEQQQFQQCPERYAPVFSGNDVVLARDLARDYDMPDMDIPGKREHGVVYADRVFLFANEETLHRFEEEPEQYIGLAFSLPPRCALDGCCPVTLREKRKWKLGNPKWSQPYQDRVFLLAGPCEQQQFQQCPERYAPSFSGNDVVLARDYDTTVSGKLAHGLVHADRVFLFASEKTLQRFVENPKEYDFLTIAQPPIMDAR